MKTMFKHISPGDFLISGYQKLDTDGKFYYPNGAKLILIIGIKPTKFFKLDFIDVHFMTLKNKNQPWLGTEKINTIKCISSDTLLKKWDWKLISETTNAGKKPAFKSIDYL